MINKIEILWINQIIGNDVHEYTSYMDIKLNRTPIGPRKKKVMSIFMRGSSLMNTVRVFKNTVHWSLINVR